MLPDRLWNPGPLTYESGSLQTALHGLAPNMLSELFGLDLSHGLALQKNEVCTKIG